METHREDSVRVFYAKDQQSWRQWLIQNHLVEQSVWLVIFKKDSGTPSVFYPEAVDEALCFGWVDSKPNKRDHQSYYQFFSKRNPKSNWSGVNKRKAESLQNAGKLAPAGIEMINLAKKTGTWTALDEVERLIIPADMQLLFDQNATALINWKNFPPSTQKGILEWIFNAKLPETRAKRIKETVDLAEKNERANQFVRR
jgi:uncharacterized protein YdeI (YjbR/CyaY-like superfamily)